MNKKNGFTLVELLAVIVVLGLILVIAVPQVMNVINDSKKGVLASSARLIANSAENIKLSNDTMGISTELQCSDVSKISANDYEDCTIEFVNGEALVTIIGKGKYEGLSVCKATSEDAEVIEGTCTTESGGGSVESTDPKCFAYADVSDDTLGVQGISITGYSLSCPKDVIIPSEIDDKPVIAIKDAAFTSSGVSPSTMGMSVVNKFYEVSTLEGKFYNAHITQLGGEFDYLGIGITSVIIPNSVTAIGKSAFERNQLTSVTIGNSVTTIGEKAFCFNDLTSVVIPNSVTTIGDYAFENNQLTSLTIGNSVTSIGSYAFYNNALTSVTIPNSVTSIKYRAFANNGLTSVIIPDSVTAMGIGTFNNNKLRDEDAYIYKRNSDGSIDNTYVVSYGGISKDIVLPSNIITIGDYAFYNNQLTSVTIPDSVTTIGSSAFESNNLTDVTVGNSVVTIGSSAFEGNNLTDVTIPNSVTTIGYSAFIYNQLTSVIIGNSVTTIGSYAFYKGESNPNFTSIINTTGRSFDWSYIITGSRGTSSITGTYNGVNVTTE